MKIVFLTAIGVGSATAVGGLIGFILKGKTLKFSNLIMSFSAGIMLAASFFGLIVPAIGGGSMAEGITLALGVLCGAAIIPIAGKIGFNLRKKQNDPCAKSTEIEKSLLFVIALAIHNLPEGIAAGVGFAADDIAGAFVIAGAVALQNIPEGMIVIPPLLAAGISPRKSLFYAVLTGVTEVIGVVLGYYFASVFESLLPVALSLAAGAMIFVSAEGAGGGAQTKNETVCRMSLVVGFSLMTFLNFLIGCII